MSKDREGGSKPSWRSGEPGGKGKGSKSGSSGKSGSQNYSWNREPEPGQVRKPTSQRKRFLTALGALVLTCSAIIALIWLLRPGRAPLLVLVGAGYTENLAVPHNVWGLNALDRLSSLPQARNGVLGFFSRPAFKLHRSAGEQIAPFLLSEHGGNASKAWETQFKGFTREAHSHDAPIIFVLALHGAADAQSPYFLIEEARPDSPNAEASKLRLDRVLSDLAKLNPNRPKILVLDPTVLQSAWNFGIVRNDFASKLQTVDMSKYKNVWVVCSSAPGQSSWIDHPSGMTGFGKALAQGLSGRAADAKDKKKASVTLASLCDFLARGTRATAAEHKASQTPMLLCDRGSAIFTGDGNPQTKSADLLKGASEIELVRSIEAAPPEPTSPPSTATETLIATGWEDAAKLESRPSQDNWGDVRFTAASYAPVAWRTFREALIRREQIYDAGYDTLVTRKNLKLEPPATLNRAIAELPGIIHEARLVALKNSATATLAMPLVRGEEPQAQHLDEARRRLDPKTFRAQWDGAVQPFLDAALTIVGSGLREDVENVLADAAILPELSAESLPAEGQFAAIAAANLPKSASLTSALLGQALSLRRSAERAAVGIEAASDSGFPYAERVEPWIRSLIDQADAKRRSGEDLLFSTRVEDHTAARDLLNDASSLYNQAQQRADAVRRSLVLCDAALADLPFLSRWVAAKSTDDALGAEQHIVKLWDLARKLADQLNDPPGDDVGKLIESTGILKDAFEASWKDFYNEVRSAEGVRALADHDHDLARMVPITDRKNFGKEAAKASKASKTSQPPSDRHFERDTATQARLALAVWGEDRFNLAVPSVTFSPVARLFEGTIQAKTVDDGLLKLAPALARCAAWVPEQIASETKNDVPKLNLETSKVTAKGLINAAQLAPWIEPDLNLPSDPTARIRIRRLFDLLKRQAERTWLDHYWSSATPPFYAEKAGKYLLDAQTLASELISSPDRTTYAENLMKPIVSLLTANDELKLDGDKHRPWTSEPELTLAYQLKSKANPEVPKLLGSPVAWATTPRGEQAPFSQTDGSDSRTPLSLGSNSAEGSEVKISLKPDGVHKDREKTTWTKPVAASAKVTTTLFFRGHKIPAETIVDLYDLPEITIAEDHTSSNGGLLVRGGEEFGGEDSALAIVFDNSGSMAYAAAGEKDRKYKVAAEVLRKVFHDIPLRKKTQVSVWTYGGDRTAVGATNDPEDRAQRVYLTRDWDPANAPGELMSNVVDDDGRPPAKWNPSRDRFWAGTPLLTSMLQALGDLKESNRSKRVLIVLTDGADSLYEDDVSSIDKPKTAEFKRIFEEKFQGSRVVVNVVLFRTDIKESIKRIPEFVKNVPPAKVAAEAKKYREYLTGLENSEKNAQSMFTVLDLFEPKGEFFTADKRGELEDQLAKYLGQRPHYEVFDGNKKRRVENEPVAPLDSLPPSFTKTLEPGDNHVVLLDKRIDVWAREEPGKTLMIDVKSNSTGYEMERGLVTTLNTRSQSEHSGWRLATMAGDPKARVRSSFEVVLEEIRSRAPEGPSRQIIQIEPKSPWFEVLAPKGVTTAPFHLEMRRLEGRGAPTWRAYLPEPPFTANLVPTVNAWWNPKSLKPKTIRVDDLKPGAKLDEGVYLDEKIVETHILPDYDNPEKLEKKPVQCLAIRLRVDKGKLARIDAADWGTVTVLHQEQRFYRAADRVTALYWPINSQDAAKLKSITISSVNALKSEKDIPHADATIDAGLFPNTKNR